MSGMDWDRLAQAIIDRRAALGYRTREALAAAAGLSSRLLADLEKNRRQNYDRITIARVEGALEWEPGTVNTILRGGPYPGMATSKAEPVDIGPELASPDGLAMWMRPDPYPYGWTLHHAGLDEEARMRVVMRQRARNDRRLLEDLDALAEDIRAEGGTVRREAYPPWLVEQYGWKVPSDTGSADD